MIYHKARILIQFRGLPNKFVAGRFEQPSKNLPSLEKAALWWAVVHIPSIGAAETSLPSGLYQHCFQQTNFVHEIWVPNTLSQGLYNTGGHLLLLKTILQEFLGLRKTTLGM